MSDKISGKFHPIPSTIANQWWISIHNIIIYLFCPNRRIFVFGVHFIPWLPWQRPPFWICSTPPKAATHYGGYSYKVDHNMAPKPWISIQAHGASVNCQGIYVHFVTTCIGQTFIFEIMLYNNNVEIFSHTSVLHYIKTFKHRKTNYVPIHHFF